MEEVEEKKTFKKMLENYNDYHVQINKCKRKLIEIQNREYSIGGGLGDGQPKPTRIYGV